jgi:PHD/YefM family antitoxin component YafN of YafNO toxin-antitoxin module
MMSIHKKIVIDEHGNPREVIIPWDQFQEIAEILGLDLDSEALEDLRQAREDRESNKHDAYITLDSI